MFGSMLALGLCFVGMAIALKVARSVTIDGKVFSEDRTLSADNVACKIDKNIPAAKAGTLTTRTSASVGTITLGVSASITTGARVTLFWTGGVRYNVLVGTVAGTSCPITSGAGDDLPIATTAVKIGVQQDFETFFDGDKLQGYAFKSSKRGIVILTDDAAAYAHHEVTAGDNQTQDWMTGGAEVNPIVGDNIAKVSLAHEDTAATAVMSFSAAVNQS